MDANGIGTDATIATHIKTIQDRNYAVKDEDARFIPTELGIALVEGYNKMGYQLNKPYLRAAMEKDCQKVAKGELSKAEMLNNCLREMKECFKCCRRDVGKLEEAIEKYVTGATNPNHHQTTMQLIGQNFSKCGKCSNYMDLRANGHQNEQGYLRGLTCKSCSQTHMLPSRGEASAHSHMCPICNFQVLSIKNTESGKMYTLCPMCYKNPPGPPDSEEGIIEMRCFSCSHDCPLASMVSGGNTVVAPCADINCRDGGMKLKKNDKGYMLGCFKYPTCRFTWWLPKFIKTGDSYLIE